MSDAYADFLASKRMVDPATGMTDFAPLPAFMKDHQRDITGWALRRGRSAIFAGTGLGKTLMELVWGSRVGAFTGKPVLAFAPLAVSAQHIREARKFGLEAELARLQADVRNGLFVTNYQKMDHFDMSAFGGAVLDESSILKSTDGHFRTRLIEECSVVPFRLAATATPAPNDFMELGNHAEFLGVMSYTDMLATFFVHDGGDTQKWRLKGHAEDDFWRWLASWAVMIRKPSDLGYSDDGYDLPPLRQHQHAVAVNYEPSMDTGMLFPMEAQSLSERIGARRDTIDERVAMARNIVLGSIESDKLAACGNQNTQRLERPNTKPANKSASDENHKLEGPRKTANTCAPTSQPIQTNPENHSISETEGSDQNTALPLSNTRQSSLDKMDDAQSAASRKTTYGASASTSITATTRGLSEGFSASIATGGSDSSEIAATGSQKPWLIWCNLNSEQDLLEREFAGRCISVRGSMTEEEKEAAILAWIAGDEPVMISKPSIMGFGLNFQHCNNMLFVGLTDSFEQVFQAIRRCWRFGQTKPVNVHFIAAETEGAVVANLRRKEADADRMAAAMVMHMANLSSANVRGAVRDRPDYFPQQPMALPPWIGAEA